MRDKLKLATLTPEKVRAGGKMVESGKVRITAPGRRAIDD
jgi:hypothetical protein